MIFPKNILVNVDGHTRSLYLNKNPYEINVNLINYPRQELIVNNPNDISIVESRKRRPWFIWIISLIQIIVFIGEIINNWILTHKLIETNLSINPLFGPSPFVLINMGGSFSPCMHLINGISNNYPCPNITSKECTLNDLCGFSKRPNQWYRFLISLFLHVGIIHLLLNLFAQILIGGNIERKIGLFRISFIYLISGIFGFIFGGNFGSEGLTRIGCSGSLFSIISLSLLHLIYNWNKIKYPKKQLIIHLIDIIINFILGLLPGIDNFSHVGGFSMGLLLGIVMFNSPTNFRRQTNIPNKWNHLRLKNWWIWCLIRFIAFILAITIFVILTENFYSRRMKCTWCKYISCLPINGWCDIGVLNKN
jgi:membrane associated rhomboid family serine protease